MNIKINSKRIVVTFIGILALCSLIFAGIFANTQAQKETTAEQTSQQNLVCSDATLSGKYAVLGSGFVPNGAPPAPLVPFAITSLMTMDGEGDLTNKVTVSRNGQIARNFDLGTYTVNEDCTGTMVINIPTPPFQLTFDLVISDFQGNRGSEFFLMATSGGVVTHTAKRIQ